MARLLLTALLAVTLEVSFARAFDAPRFTSYVNDDARLLSLDARKRIEARLAQFHAERGPQFALLTVESLGGVSLEEYAIETVEAWKLGDVQRDDGLLLLVVKEDRRVRIEVGHGLEGAIPDAVASRVIDEILTPAFKQGDYAWGIEAAFNELIVKAGGAPVATKAPRKRTTGAVAARSESPSLREGLKKPKLWIFLGAFFGIPVLAIVVLATMWKRGFRPPRSRGERLVDQRTGEAWKSGKFSALGYPRSSSSAGARSGSSSSSSASSGSDSGSGGVSGGGGSFGGGGASGSW